MTRRVVLPSRLVTLSAPGIRPFRGSMASLRDPLPTLRPAPHGTRRTARGRYDSLGLHRRGLAPPAPCRSPGALPAARNDDSSIISGRWYRARGWWGGRARNQDSYQRPDIGRTVRNWGRWYDTVGLRSRPGSAGRRGSGSIARQWDECGPIAAAAAWVEATGRGPSPPAMLSE
jgi:hypothetical protein